MLNNVLGVLCMTIPIYTLQGALLLLTFLQDHHHTSSGLADVAWAPVWKVTRRQDRKQQLGFWEKAMPREQSWAALTVAGDDRVPQVSKVTDILLLDSERRMNFVITLLMFFPDAQRTGRNQVKSVSKWTSAILFVISSLQGQFWRRKKRAALSFWKLRKSCQHFHRKSITFLFDLYFRLCSLPCVFPS